MRHLEVIVNPPEQPRSVRRGLPRQRRSREAERTARRSAVGFARWLEHHGTSCAAAARRLHLSPSALARWRRRWQQDRMALRPRGRPAQDVDRNLRQDILSVFSLMGPHASLLALRDLFPGVARAALENLLDRCRRVFRRRHRWCLRTLRWTRPGTVWAMDFTELLSPIDAEYRYLLLIRDLASGRQLLTLPCRTPSAAIAVVALRSLFRFCGRPLALKMDNGAAFVAEELRALLRAHGVFPLYSPPGTPAYNGSVEAGIGALEVRAFYESARHDRPGEWTCDDVATARLQANATARPHGPYGPTPDQAWQSRTRVTDIEAHLFSLAYDRECQRARAERESEGPTGDSHWLRASIDRVALSRALIERGYLLIRSRRITPPITLRSARRIS